MRIILLSLICLAAQSEGHHTAESLLRNLESPSLTIREDALSAVTDSHLPAKLALPAIIEAVTDSRGIRDIRDDQSITALGIRAAASYGADAVPYLLEGLRLVNDAEGELSPKNWTGFAVGALAAIGRPAVPPLIRALQDPSLRGSAAWALGDIGPKAAEALVALESHRNDKDERTRSLVAFALKRIAPQ